MAYTVTSNCTGCMACARICPTGAVTGEKKQLHRIDAAICISCGACGRVCPSEAVRDDFGLAVRRIPRRQWDRPRFDLAECMSCAICLDTCPAAAISQTLRIDGNPHLFPILEAEARCIGCGFCAADCPTDAITMVPRNEARPGQKEAPVVETQAAAVAER